MSGMSDRFFDQLGEVRHVRLVEGTSGTILIEIEDGERAQRWYVTIHRGDVSVSRSGADPDCTIRTDRDTFEAILAGKVSAMPAVLRGLVQVEGKMSLLAALQALFKPSAGTAEQRTAGYARRQ